MSHEEKIKENCSRPTGSFYVVMVLNILIWILLIISLICYKMYRRLFDNDNRKKTTCTQTDSELSKISTVIVHPDNQITLSQIVGLK